MQLVISSTHIMMYFLNIKPINEALKCLILARDIFNYG